MEKIMKKCGAERISDSAKIMLKNIIEDKAEEISQLAIKYATHAGRKTIMPEDIKLAFKE
jgi:DNA-binding protein